MYTQCPQCDTVFRVTAAVLRQAAGRVRCGGCGNAFNAIEYLSEERPEPRESSPRNEPELPELRPDPAELAGDQAPAPAATSPEYSAALQQTLDQLAGSDVRLEDTGVEWRVLGDPEQTDATTAQGAWDEHESSRASLLDEELSADLESRRVDELLSNTPTPIDEYLTDSGETKIDSPEVFDATATITIPDNELRFDDNTGLPDDFYDEDSGEHPLVVPETPEQVPEPMIDQQVDLVFGGADEWRDLLDEVEPTGEPPGATAATDSSEKTLAEELDALDLDEADDADQYDAADDLSSQVEALGLELSGIQQELDGLADTPEDQAPGEPGAETVATGEAGFDAGHDTAWQEANTVDDDEPRGELAAGGDVDDQPRTETAGDSPDSEVEAPLAALREEVDAPGDADIEAASAEPAIEEEAAADEYSISIDDELFSAAFETEARAEAERAAPEVAPLTEEEQTINMMIDQDLLSVAVTDNEGFAATIVGEKAAFEAAIAEAEADEAETPAAEDSELFETIIMEGADARSEKDAARAEALKEEAAALLAASAETEEPKQKQVDWRMLAGIAALLLLLFGQAVHFSRESLAKVPFFHDLLAPIYEKIGAPLTPGWAVTGWRFEATRGSTDETGETLSIFARIGNQSDSAMPYPVISVTLTDRFEETIGNRVFGPAEYLADDLDTGRLVASGNTFNALMAIESPTEEASGFKLNVCYRLSGSLLRCAIKDFR